MCHLQAITSFLQCPRMEMRRMQLVTKFFSNYIWDFLCQFFKLLIFYAWEVWLVISEDEKNNLVVSWMTLWIARTKFHFVIFTEQLNVLYIMFSLSNIFFSLSIFGTLTYIFFSQVLNLIHSGICNNRIDWKAETFHYRAKREQGPERNWQL